jgi:hypothetical protein
MRKTTLLKSFAFYFVAVGLVGAYSTFSLVALPADPQNVFFAGYSAARLTAIFFIGLPTLICLWLSVQLVKFPENQERLLLGAKRFIANSWMFNITTILGIVGFMACAKITMEVLGEPANAYQARVLPVLYFVGLASVLTSAILVLGQQKIIQRFTSWFQSLQPNSLALAAFLVAFIFIYFPVVFYQQGMRSRPDFVPFKESVGYDLDWEIQASQGYFERGYTGQLPVNVLVFAPLQYLDFGTAYRIFAISSLTAFLFLAIIFPLLIQKKEKALFPIAIFGIAGLFSYGLQFEIEQGQYNLIVFVLCLIAIYLFHYHPRLRILAYSLFSVGLQMKLWPGVFILMLVDDWRDWKTILKRFSLLLAANVILLFVLGPPRVLTSFNYIQTEFLEHIGAWTHSIQGGLISWGRNSVWIMANSDWLTFALFGILAGSITATLYKIIRDKERGINPYLFFVCVLAAMLVPTLSNDYKIPMLIAPMIIFVSSVILPKKGPRRAAVIVLIFIAALAHSTTYFSFVIKPPLLENNMPVLVVLLIAITATHLLLDKRSKNKSLGFAGQTAKK